MSDHDELDASKASRPASAGHARGERSGNASGVSRGADGAAPGRQTLTESSSSGGGGHDIDVSRAFLTRTVNAARAEMVKLAAAVEAIDYFPALISATVLRDHLRIARVRVDSDFAHDGPSTRTVDELERDGNELLAKAPILSAEATPSSEKSNQEAQSWRAQRRGDRKPHSESMSPMPGNQPAEASPRALPPGSRAEATGEPPRSPASPHTPARPTQRAGSAHAPPDLGNYDSEVGKHVVVLRSWDDIAVTTRRVELQSRLAITLDVQARDKLLREYEALEWVARERNLALPKDPGEQAAPQAYVGGKPTKFWAPDTAQGGRAMLEREMAEGTSYGAAKDHAAMRIAYATTQRSPTDNDKRLIGDQQGQLMDHDAAAFRASFQVEAKQTALSMLDASSVAVDTVLRSYGIAGGAFRLTDAARKVAENPGSLDAEVETWLALSRRLDGNQAAFAAGHGNREALAKEAQHLRDLQDNIAALASEQLRLIKLEQARHPQHAGMAPPQKQPDLSKLEGMAGKNSGSARSPFDRLPKPAVTPPEQQLAFVQGALQLRQAEFRTAWINAERAHPVLAAYRAGKPPDASALAGMGSDENTTRSVIKQVLPKLGNIVHTKAALIGSWGTLDPLQLAPVVELTKQRMFVAEGSYRDRVVHDMAEQAHEKDGGIAHWAFQAVMVGLTVLTLVPTGGTSAMAALALTGLAYDIYAGLGEYEDFKLASAAGDTDLDMVRSLSDTEPSLTPLLMRMVSAGVNFTIAASLFKRAVALREMVADSAAEREALAALNKAGEEHGVAGIGDEAAHARAIRGVENRPRPEQSFDPRGKPKMETDTVSLDGHAFHNDIRKLSPEARHAIRQMEERGWVRVDQIHAKDLVDISKWFGREIGVVQAPYGRLRLILGTRDGVLTVQLAKYEVFVVHTHPVMVSDAGHFRLDISNAGKHVEAVIDWSGQITYYNKAGLKNPLQNSTIAPLEDYQAAFMDERGNVIGFAKVDIVDGADGARIQVRE